MPFRAVPMDGTLMAPGVVPMSPLPESLIQPVIGDDASASGWPQSQPACASDGTVALPNPTPRTGVNTGHFVPQPVGVAPIRRPVAGDRIDRIGRYTILKPIGEGGFGTVYLAEQHEPVRRKVALKVVKLGMDTAEVILRFEAERQALAVMDHPSVAKVYDAGVTERGQPFFAMEYVEGVPLGDYADAQKLSTTDRIKLFIAICQAVQHAHQKGLIHRDLKPGNILVSTVDGKPLPKVIDFGIAKATSPDPTNTSMQTVSGQLMGTPEYMSPEQTVGNADIDTRTDVYSLGAVLYELLTGFLPFDSKELRAGGLAGITHIIKTVEPPRPSTRIAVLNPKPETIGLAHLRQTEPKQWHWQIAGDLDWITLRAMEKERERRYESAAALALDLQRFLDNEPVLASPPSKVYRLKKFARRNKILFAASTAVAIALVVGLTAAIAGFITASQQRDVAREQRGRAETAQAIAEAAQKKEHQALLDADFARIAAVNEKNNAETELAKSNELTQFMQKMFESIDPNLARGKSILVRNVLDAAAADLDRGQLANKPAVEAEIRSLIGNTYASLGSNDVAVVHLSKALELDRKNNVANSPQTLADEARLGKVLLDLGRPDEALPHFVAVIDARRKYFAGDQRGLAHVLADQAKALIALKRLELAEPPLRENLRVSEAITGPSSTDTGAAVSDLASLLYQRGEVAAAEPLFRRALAIYQPAYKADDLRTVTLEFNLASACRDTGNLAEAYTLLNHVLSIRKGVLQAGHADILRAEEALAELLDQQATALMGLSNTGTTAATRPIPAAPGVSPIMQARQTLEESIKVRQAIDPKHGGLPPTYEMLGDVCQDLGDLPAAEAALQRALDLRRELQGPGDVATIRAMSNLAGLYQRREQFEKGLPLAEEVVARARSQTPPPSPTEMALYLAQLGALQMQTSQPGKAEVTLKECLSIREKLLAPGAWQLHNTRSMIGGCLWQIGKKEEGLQLLRDGAAQMALDPKCPTDRLAQARARLSMARAATTVTSPQR